MQRNFAAFPLPGLRWPILFLSTGSEEADRIERALAGLCAVGVGGIWLAGHRLASQGDWPDLVAISAIILLAAAAGGVWLTQHVWNVPRRSFGWLIDAFSSAPQALIGGDSASRPLVLDEMAGVELTLAHAVRRSGESAEQAHETSAGLADSALALACAIRERTGAITAMRDIATRTSEAVKMMQETVGAVFGRARDVAETADQAQIGLAQITREARALELDMPGSQVSLQTMQSVCATSTAMLDAMLATVTELSLAASGYAAPVQEISLLLSRQQDEFQRFSAAMSEQAEQVSDLTSRILSLQAVCGEARADSAATVALDRTRRDGARRLWRHAADHPGRTEAIARLIETLPDFEGACRLQAD